MLKTEDQRRKLEASPRFVAAVVRGLLIQQDFSSLADLTDAVKTVIARVHLAVTDETLSTAYQWVHSRRPLVAVPPAPAGLPPSATEPPVSHDEAVALLRTLRACVKRMPAPSGVSPRTVDKQRALEMVLDEIERTRERCAALEAETVDDEVPSS